LHFAVGGQSPEAEVTAPQPMQALAHTSLQVAFAEELVAVTDWQLGLEELQEQVQVHLSGGATQASLQQAYRSLGQLQRPPQPFSPQKFPGHLGMHLSGLLPMSTGGLPTSVTVSAVPLSSWLVFSGMIGCSSAVVPQPEAARKARVSKIFPCGARDEAAEFGEFGACMRRSIPAPTCLFHAAGHTCGALSQTLLLARTFSSDI